MNKTMGYSWRQRIKSWPAWLLLIFTAVLLLAIGTQRDPGPATPQERLEIIARELACPTCDGESVSESRGTASQAIRQEIARLVADGQLTDSEIVQTIDNNYSEDLQLVPGTSGLESLIWALPIAVAITAIVGLVLAFRRWQQIEQRSANDDDLRLVASALAEHVESTSTQKSDDEP